MLFDDVHCIAVSDCRADRLAAAYLDRTRSLARGARRVVDKNLENYKHLGLIALLFPGSRVIHCRRDPLDTCLSCYFSYLLQESNPFASDLADLGFARCDIPRIARDSAREV